MKIHALCVASVPILLETFRFWLDRFGQGELVVSAVPFKDTKKVSGRYDLVVALIVDVGEAAYAADMLKNLQDTNPSIRSLAILCSQKKRELPSIARFTTILDGKSTVATLADELHVFDSKEKALGVSEKQNMFTSRERQVLGMLAKGLSTKEISFELGISVHTVVAHRRSLYMKTGIHSLQQLAVFAALHPTYC